MAEVKNPILSGFYPDPSICSVLKRNEKGEAVEADCYLVNSTFAYVPGVPVFHSRDLCNWKQIGHVLERKEQLKVDGIGISRGIYAPTIRYHKGIFYMITTNVSAGGNFYVTAENPAGPWSDPILLADAQGIDPSLFFEGDKCYYIGQRTKADAKYNGDCEIWLQELDLEQKKLVGDVYVLWDGAMKHAIWPEGPHLYKRGDYYYVMIAEGGTAESHSICVARSKVITGPYEPCPNNPIFSHRHMGRTAKIQAVGHGDLVEMPGDKWYVVMLATRPLEGYAPLGRETFLAEVAWENDWPVINPGEGRLRDVQQVVTDDGQDAFARDAEATKTDCVKWTKPLDMRCLTYGWPAEDMYKIAEDGSGDILLKVSDASFAKKESPSFICIRATAPVFSVETKMQFAPKVGQEAGLVYLFDENNYIKFTLYGKTETEKVLRVVSVICSEETLIKEMPVEELSAEKEQKTAGHKVDLRLCLDGLRLTCEADGTQIGMTDVRKLTSEAVEGGFVGCTMGIYAAGDDKKADNYACFSELHICKE